MSSDQSRFQHAGRKGVVAVLQHHAAALRGFSFRELVDSRAIQKHAAGLRHF